MHALKQWFRKACTIAWLPHFSDIFLFELSNVHGLRCWRLFMIKLWNHGLLDASTMNNCNMILERCRDEGSGAAKSERLEDWLVSRNLQFFRWQDKWHWFSAALTHSFTPVLPQSLSHNLNYYYSFMHMRRDSTGPPSCRCHLIQYKPPLFNSTEFKLRSIIAHWSDSLLVYDVYQDVVFLSF